jgi:hypothetical protein
VRQSRRDCSRTKPRLKKLVRRPQWTRSTSRERHIGRRLHSSPGGRRRSRAGHCSFRLIPAARHSIAWMPVPRAEPQLGQQQPSRTGTSIGTPAGAETLAVQGIPDLQPRSSSQANFAYDPPDEMPADGELAATLGRRPELLIWADNAHTRWQLTASRIDGSVCTAAAHGGWSAWTRRCGYRRLCLRLRPRSAARSCVVIREDRTVDSRAVSRGGVRLRERPRACLEGLVDRSRPQVPWRMTEDEHVGLVRLKRYVYRESVG